MDRGLNLLTWQRRHLWVWALLIMAGGVGGPVFG
jgi:hypothetical protein